MPSALSVLVVEEDRDRAITIIDALKDIGATDVTVISELSGLARRVAALDPDLVLVDIASPSRDILEELSLASAPLERPVAMFVDHSDETLTNLAIHTGLSAYVVDGLTPDRIRHILTAARARFQVARRVRDELAETKRALEERKVIDRAKGLLMSARGLTEEDAYGVLRKAAMDQGKRISDVAGALISAAELLK